MSGPDIFYGCLGVSAIIVAFGIARAVVDALPMIERVLTAEREAKRPRELPTEKPWGSAP